jgi:kinesin family protein 13
MIEIYNEKVHDLFQHPSKRQKAGLKVRENKGDVFVDGLTKVPVESYEEIEKQINIGNSNRTIASTAMNSTSSRAHTVTTISFKQTIMEGGKPLNQKRSDINLVDLAGSERQSGTGATGDRLKEGSNINKSLSFLGKCITVLAEKSSGKVGGKNAVVPYRESQLTRILQNALGGNSKTTMIAALSPASINYDETLSTLRYANQVKSIKNDAKVNESAHDKLVRELREENDRLKLMMEQNGDPRQDLISFNTDFGDKCYLMNVNEDPQLTGQVKHVLDNGKNKVGKSTKDSKVDIRIGGTGIAPDHCDVQFDKSGKTVTLIPNKEDPQKFKTILNGEVVESKVQLAHGDKILFGNHNLYTIVFPGQEVTEEMQDYDEIMKFMVKDALNMFTGGDSDQEMREKMETMRKKMDEEKAELDAKLKAEKAKMIEEKKKLAKQMEEQRKKLLEEYKAQSDSAEKAKLQEEMKKQQEETDRIKKEQIEKEKQYEEEKANALKEMEDKKRDDHKMEVEIMQKKDLEHKLAKLIPQLNEVNEICQNLGRYTYNYEPHIEVEILPDGRRVPKAVVKAYPDRDKDFHNTLSFEEFEDKMYMIKEKWENMQFDIDNGDINAELELEPDERESEIFGLSITNEEKLIGNVYIFCDSLSSLLETHQDSAPILNSKGETKGFLTYTLVPSAFDEKGDSLNLTHYEGVNALINQTLLVDFEIAAAKSLPEKYSNEVYCSYQWIDEAADNF